MFQTVTLRTLDIHLLYRGVQAYLEFQHPKLKLRHFGSSIMSGSNLQGRWMASSVIEEDIAKLKEVSYLTADIKHRLPALGQVIPTPEPNESVVFVSHFLCGLGLLWITLCGGSCSTTS